MRLIATLILLVTLSSCGEQGGNNGVKYVRTEGVFNVGDAWKVVDEYDVGQGDSLKHYIRMELRHDDHTEFRWFVRVGLNTTPLAKDVPIPPKP